MKKICLYLICIALLAACKKQGAPAPKENLMTSIMEDDKLQYAFEYSSDKKLKKVKNYTGGAVTPIWEDTYEYDGQGYLKEKIRDKASGLQKFVYECDNDGKVLKISEIPLSGTDSGKVDVWRSYTYNARHQLIKITYYMKDDKLEGYETFEYTDDNNLKSIKAYVESPGGSKLQVAWIYSGSTNRYDPSLLKTFNEPDIRELMFLTAKSISITLYANGVPSVMISHAMSDRKSAIACPPRTAPGPPISSSTSAAAPPSSSSARPTWRPRSRWTSAVSG